MNEALETYDLEGFDEDIFKHIYQEIVKRGERHRTGEYYTPEWLAEMTLNEAINELEGSDEKKIISILDPACGSGAFLTNAITLLKKRGCSLENILNNVCGMDLNPLAVAISRANYVLALGKLIEKRTGPIFIPVFMADSIKLPTVRKELEYGKDILAIDVDNNVQLNLPMEIALNESELKVILDEYAQIISEYKRNRLTKENALKIFERSKCCDKQSMSIVRETLNTIIRTS